MQFVVDISMFHACRPWRNPMNKRKSILLLGLFLAVVLMANTGCQKNETSKQMKDGIDISVPVELSLYLVGNQPKDAQLVFEELNKLIQEDLNAQLTVNFIPWSVYEHKYPLILSSGVGVDLIYTSDWCFYDSEARKGALHSITEEDIKTYMPQTYATQPKESFVQAQIDNKIYMIPNNQKEYASYKLVAIRGDLREKYGLGELKNLDDLEKYYEAIIENNEDIVPYLASVDNKELAAIAFWQTGNYIPLSSGFKISPFAILYQEETIDYQLINIFETQEYTDFANKMKEWQEKGFWLPNAVSNKVSAQSSFENGTSASLIWNIGTLTRSYINMMQDHPEWKPEIYDLTPNANRTIAKYTNNGMAISTQSKNYERSLMLLDLLKNDERYWNLTWLGIEGKHWEKGDGNTYKTLPESDQFSYAATSCWGWGNEPFLKESVMTSQQASDLLLKWQTENTVAPVTEFFRFNQTQLIKQLAACQDVLNKYQVAIELGMIENIDETMAEMENELNAVGWNEIEKEFEKQYHAFIIE